MPIATHILAATDFGELGQRAVQAASELAELLGATLSLVHAFTLADVSAAGLHGSEAIARDEARAGEQLEAVAAPLRARLSVGAVRVVVGEPVHTVTQLAGELGCDLLVVGTHGRHGLRHALLGSVAETIVRDAPCAVLVVR